MQLHQNQPIRTYPGCNYIITNQSEPRMQPLTFCNFKYCSQITCTCRPLGDTLKVCTYFALYFTISHIYRASATWQCHLYSHTASPLSSCRHKPSTVPAAWQKQVSERQFSKLFSQGAFKPCPDCEKIVAWTDIEDVCLDSRTKPDSLYRGGLTMLPQLVNSPPNTDTGAVLTMPAQWVDSPPHTDTSTVLTMSQQWEDSPPNTDTSAVLTMPTQWVDSPPNTGTGAVLTMPAYWVDSPPGLTLAQF